MKVLKNILYITPIILLIYVVNYQQNIIHFVLIKIGDIVWAIFKFFADGAYKIVQLRFDDLTIFQIIFLIWLAAFSIFPIKDKILDLTLDRWSSLLNEASRYNSLRIETKFYFSLFMFIFWCIIIFVIGILLLLGLGAKMNLYIFNDIF